MRYIANIVIDFEADDYQDAFEKAIEYALSAEDLPDVFEAWHENVKENDTLDNGKVA